MNLRQRIKEVMASELMLEISVDEIADDAPLFGPNGIGLDSVDALQLVVMVAISSCDSLEAKLSACVRVAAAHRLANGAAAATGDASEYKPEDGVAVCDALAQTWLYRKGCSDAAAVTQSGIHDVATILLGGIEDAPASIGPAIANACTGGSTPPRIERVVATLAAYPFVCRACPWRHHFRALSGTRLRSRMRR